MQAGKNEKKDKLYDLKLTLLFLCQEHQNKLVHVVGLKQFVNGRRNEI